MANELVRVAEDSARSGFYLISGSALATGTMAIASILIGRLLGPQLYGQYTLALVVPQLLFLLTNLGIDQGITRFAASLGARGEAHRIPELIRSGLLFKLSLGTAVSVVSFALADQFAALINRPHLSPYIQIAAISIVFQAILATATSAFLGLDKTQYTALTKNIQAIAKTVLSVGLVLLGFSVTGAIAGYVAGYVAAGILAAVILLSRLLNPQEDGVKGGVLQNLRILTSYGMPLYASMLLTGFLSVYQNLILGLFTTDVEVGNFKAATNFIALITLLSMSITTALLPAFSKLTASTTEKINAFFKLANKYTCLLLVPATALTILFAKQMVQTIYGSKFQSAPFFLSTYSLLYLLVGIGYLTLTSLFNGLGETRTTLRITLINSVILMTLAPVLAAIYSVLGLILAFLIANAVATSYGAYIASNKFKIQVDTQSTIKIYAIAAISSIPSLLLLHFTPVSGLIIVIPGGLLYLFVYTTLLPLGEILNGQELQKARHTLQGIRPLAFIVRPIIKYQERILQARKRTYPS